MDRVSEAGRKHVRASQRSRFGRVPNLHVSLGAGSHISLSENLIQLTLWHSLVQLIAASIPEGDGACLKPRLRTGNC